LPPNCMRTAVTANVSSSNGSGHMPLPAYTSASIPGTWGGVASCTPP
jgi:hypothetical protein